MTDVFLRECKKEDISYLAELEKTCFLDAWTKEQIESEFARFGFYGLIAEEKGEIVGYLFSGLLFERGDLERIAVKESARGRGLGGKLLDRLLLDAKEKGVEEMLLEVRESNFSARKLYESRGFILFHTRKGYYAGGENALEMQKRLGE